MLKKLRKLFNKKDENHKEQKLKTNKRKPLVSHLPTQPYDGSSPPPLPPPEVALPSVGDSNPSESSAPKVGDLDGIEADGALESEENLPKES